MPIRLEAIDRDTSADRSADLRSLIIRMERTGKLKTVKSLAIMKARALYVTKLRDKRDVAAEVGVDMPTLDRWIFQFAWDELRQEKEFQLYRKVSNIRRQSIPNIDQKHDQMFHSLESLIEDTIYRIKRDEIELNIKDLNTLSKAAQTCMDCRRTIHRKEAPASRQIIELQDQTLFNEFATMLQEAVTKPKPRITLDAKETIKQIPYQMEDQELEDEEDLV